MARSSKTPGRTQLINFFELDGGGRLVDLPGYGYARAPESTRRRWRPLIEGYFHNREGLRGIILLMDVRHPLKEFDWQMLEWTEALGLPCHILLTKADKLGYGKARSALMGVRRELEGRDMHPGTQLFSATTRLGREEAEARILSWLRVDEISQ